MRQPGIRGTLIISALLTGCGSSPAFIEKVDEESSRRTVSEGPSTTGSEDAVPNPDPLVNHGSDDVGDSDATGDDHEQTNPGSVGSSLPPDESGGEAGGGDDSGSQGNVGNPGNPGGPASPGAEGSIVRMCQNAAATETMTTELNFTRTAGQGCQVKGAKSGNNMTAYRRQDLPITIPDGATLCLFELQTNQQSINYDDELLLTLDNYFLAGANHRTEDLVGFGMQKTGDLVSWDWAKHYNTKRDQNTGGCSAPVSCEFPRTQTTGAVRVDVPSTWLDKLPNGAKKNSFTLSVIATGNQNSGSDCGHTGLKFTAKIKYVFTE